MSFTASKKIRKRHGFSLIEVVMTLIIGALLLSTASYYLYSILNIYERTRKNPAFDEHVQNVTLFLSNALLQAQNTHYIFEVASEKNTPATNNSSAVSQPSTEQASPAKKPSEFPIVAWKHPPGTSEHEPYSLSFTFYTPNPLIELPHFPSYPTIAYLELNPEEGLYLIWHISKAYYKDDPLPVYRTLISPHVKKLEYFYFNKDKSEWTPTTETPDDETGAKDLPKMLRITFSDGSNSEAGTILINNELSLEGFL